MKKIVFWMPRACMEPAGGFKIVFEYANRLAKDGFPVEIIYPMVHYGARYDWKHTIVYRLIFLWRLIFRTYKPNGFVLRIPFSRDGYGILKIIS